MSVGTGRQNILEITVLYLGIHKFKPEGLFRKEKDWNMPTFFPAAFFSLHGQALPATHREGKLTEK